MRQEDCGAAGALIITAGLGHGAGSLAEAAERAAHKYGMRLIGPNCLGVMMPGASLNASFSAHMPGEGNLALISQSGAIAAGMVDWAAQRAVGLFRNCLDRRSARCRYRRSAGLFRAGWQDAGDPALCRSDQGRPQVHVRGARRRRIKPVVVVKSGRMAQGAKAAATHTGALAGSDAVYDAAFRRAGIVRVSDLRELFDCAETLGRARIRRRASGWRS